MDARYLVFVRENLNKFKLESLLKETCMESRRLPAITQENLEEDFSNAPDYETTDQKLTELIIRSEEYLLHALEGIHETL